ncbi:MAG TPA: DUF6338 family protein [Acidobacteriaceae bacterium]|jgi:CHASE1-domain containing sensor protein|nr:DUF6338 family protein [Acidobacteriaceae bacterium]
MPDTVVALEILLILLPGFSAAYIVQMFAVRAKQTDLEKVIEALLFSFVIYVSYSLILHGSMPVTAVHSAEEDTLQFHRINLLWLTGLTLFFSLLMILYVNKDGARWFRFIGLTERTSRNSIWNDTFQDIQQKVDPAAGSIVQVELEDGRRVMGVVKFYSDTAKECSVFLQDAQWIDDDGMNPIPIDGPGILLTGNARITSISFLDPPPD